MKINKPKYNIIILILLLLCLPIIINLCYYWETEYIVLQKPSSWATFWATYLAAIASFGMVFITWWTMKQSKKQNDKILAQNEKLILQNKEQLDEMKKQWAETNRARLNFSIISYEGLFLLKVTNCGIKTAFNISLQINNNFIDSHFSNKIKQSLSSLANKPFCLEAGVSKYYYISPIYGDSLHYIGNESFPSSQINKWLDEHKSQKIKISGIYCDLYPIHEEFSIDDYINMSVVVTDELTSAVEKIKKGMIVQNNQFYPIQKSLDIIARNIVEINKENKL